jgi:ATP-dependent Clp protease ATP-binding subunit ClpB
VTGFDPVYGARPLRRLVQSAIGDQLARELLSGEIADGDTVLVELDEADDALVVSSYREPDLVPGSDGRSSSSRS